MLDLYQGIDYVAAKQGGANTGNIDATFANFEAQSQGNTVFATVVSAMREEETFNTTKMLVEIGELLATGQTPGAMKKLNDLKDFHIFLLEKNHSDMRDRQDMKNFILQEFQRLGENILHRDVDFIPTQKNDFCIRTPNGLISLKGFGETFCAEFYKRLCDIRGININLVDLSSQAHSIVGEDSEERTFSNALEFFRANVGKKLISGNNVIVPGYIGGISGGIDAAIGEGYSDATAALVAVTIKEILGENKRVLLEILKSVPGIMSADPRLLRGSTQEAQILREIDFWIAKEIVGVRGAQARLLNSAAMLPQVIQSGIDIRLRDPSLGQNPGTLISHDAASEKIGVETILGRRNVAMISMSSFSMGQGFIAKIMEVVKGYASVDIIGTSETEFAFTVDMKSGISQEKIHQMIDTLKTGYLNKPGDSIDISFRSGLLFCIGHNMKQSGILKKVGEALERGKLSANLVSQGLNQRALIIGLDHEGDVEKGVQLLHEAFKLSV